MRRESRSGLAGSDGRAGAATPALGPGRAGLACWGPRRPAGLVQAINTQAPAGRVISWKVLNDTLRRLEASGHLARRQVPGGPRETWYWLCPPGKRLICALTMLDDWYSRQDPPASDDTGHNPHTRPGRHRR